MSNSARTFDLSQFDFDKAMVNYNAFWSNCPKFLALKYIDEIGVWRSTISGNILTVLHSTTGRYVDIEFSNYIRYAPTTIRLVFNYVDSSKFNLLTMNLIKVPVGTYRISKDEYESWFNQDETQPWCDIREIMFCKEQQF